MEDLLALDGAHPPMSQDDCTEKQPWLTDVQPSFPTQRHDHHVERYSSTCGQSTKVVSSERKRSQPLNPPFCLNLRPSPSKSWPQTPYTSLMSLSPGSLVHLDPSPEDHDQSTHVDPHWPSSHDDEAYDEQSSFEQEGSR